MIICSHKIMARKRAKANYFTKETEDYIVKYNESTDQEYRNKIFTDHIYLPQTWCVWPNYTPCSCLAHPTVRPRN